jgi:hypothetical protein
MVKAAWVILIVVLVCGSLGALWYVRSRHVANDDMTPRQAWEAVRQRENPAQSAYESAQQIGTITDRRLDEVSGITASRRNDGVWWVHNDSGDLPRIYAINSTGKLLGIYRVVGAINVDWEDIGSGPGADGSPALYIADIGDNEKRRDAVVVYRVKEPDLSAGGESGQTESAEPFQFRYPDGAHNAEALIVDPESGRIYVITKRQSSPCSVYRSPWPLKLGEPMMFEPVTGAAVATISQWRLVTGAAASPDAGRVVIRTYFSAYELLRSPGKGFESIFDASPSPVALPLEQQGEAIAYTRDGRYLVTTSEQLPAPIHQLKRK